jgi:dTDP-4-dehydrorhamnose reductase
MGKIQILGGFGLLGKEFAKIDKSLIFSGKSEIDITNYLKVSSCLSYSNPSVVILCAAVLDNGKKEEIIKTNIQGTANVALACMNKGIRMVYISTDYVYEGILGNYKESDPLLPTNDYAWSKLGGECSVRMVPNHLIIRTSFGASDFFYQHAYNNKWTSKDYVDVIAPMILEASKSDLTGIINIGTEKKTMLNYARRRNPNITGKPLTDNSSPKDSSLNLDKWKSFHKSIQPVESADTES